MTIHSIQGRPWLKLSEAKDKQIVELDNDFTCQSSGQVILHADKEGRLYFECDEGHHYIEGQADDGEHCVGIYTEVQP